MSLRLGPHFLDWSAWVEPLTLYRGTRMQDVLKMKFWFWSKRVKRRLAWWFHKANSTDFKTLTLDHHLLEWTAWGGSRRWCKMCARWNFDFESFWEKADWLGEFIRQTVLISWVWELILTFWTGVLEWSLWLCIRGLGFKMCWRWNFDLWSFKVKGRLAWWFHKAKSTDFKTLKLDHHLLEWTAWRGV